MASNSPSVRLRPALSEAKRLRARAPAVRAETIRVVGPDSQQIGVMPVARALYMARDLELDLVEIAPDAKPPVCRIMDYGKYRYEQKKREKDQKKKHKSYQLKEIVFRPSIDIHDFEVKMKHLRKFLETDHKTRIRVRFRRAELAHKERGFQLLSRIEKYVEDIGKVVKPPGFEGRQMVMVLAPTGVPVRQPSESGHAGVKNNAQNKDKEISSEKI